MYTHAHSLGVVFLSVSDTADLGHQDEKLLDVIREVDHSSLPHTERLL